MRGSGRIAQHLRGNVVGYVALFCFAVGGTALALPGRNSVDSGDIKPANVRTGDLAPQAVKAAKLADGSIGFRHLTENSVEPQHIVDSERTVAIPPAALVQNAPANDNPEIFANSGYQVAAFDPGAEDQVAALTQIPLDRAEGTPIEVRLRWSANGTGDAAWRVGYDVVIANEQVVSVPSGDAVTETAPAVDETVESLVVTIPPEELANGAMLALRITRVGTLPGDTLPVFARLHLVEVRYAAAS